MDHGGMDEGAFDGGRTRLREVVADRGDVIFEVFGGEAHAADRHGAENLTDVWGLLNTANQVKAALPSDTASLYHYTFTKNVSVSSGNRYSYADLYFKFENKAYSVFTPFGTQDFAVTRTSDGTSYSPYAYAATKNGTASFDFYTTMELTPLSWTFAVFNGYDWVYTNESFTGTLTPTSVPFLDFLTAEAKKAGISEEVYRQCLRDHGDEFLTMRPANTLAFFDDFFGVLDGTWHRSSPFLDYLLSLWRVYLPQCGQYLLSSRRRGSSLRLLTV